MKFALRTFCMAGLAVAGLANLARAELVENPMYVAWAQFQRGAYSTLVGTLELGSTAGEAPTRMQQQIIYKLIDVKPDYVLVETTTSVRINGRWNNYPPQTVKIPAKAEKGTEGVLSVEDGTVGEKKTLTDLLVVKERVEAAGRIWESTSREYTMDLVQDNVPGGGKVSMRSKGWYVNDVPGGLVKVESLGVGALQTTIKMQLDKYGGIRVGSTRPATGPGTEGGAPSVPTNEPEGGMGPGRGPDGRGPGGRGPGEDPAGRGGPADPGGRGRGPQG